MVQPEAGSIHAACFLGAKFHTGVKFWGENVANPMIF
jgi:hypothetical protein